MRIRAFNELIGLKFGTKTKVMLASVLTVAFFCLSLLAIQPQTVQADPVLPNTYNPVKDDTDGGQVVTYDEKAEQEKERALKAKKHRTLIESIGVGVATAGAYLGFAFIRKNKKERK